MKKGNQNLVQEANKLWNNVGRLKQYVDVFEGFFRSDSSKALAGLPVGVDDFFLPIVRDAFTDTIVLQIGTLLDRDKSSISLASMAAKCNSAGHDFNQRLDVIRNNAKPVLAARNKCTAHVDRRIAFKERHLDEVPFGLAADLTDQIVLLAADIYERVGGEPPEPFDYADEGEVALRFLAESIELRDQKGKSSVTRFLSTR